MILDELELLIKDGSIIRWKRKDESREVRVDMKIDVKIDVRVDVKIDVKIET